MANSNQDFITTISFSEISSKEHSKSVLDKIEQGFGNSDSALGIIAITDIPNYEAIRSKMLHLSHQFATCTPVDILEQLTIPSANYQVGWSHGQERVEGDKFDDAKGSYYANPLSDNVLEHVLKRDFPNYSDQDLEKTQEKEKRDEYIRIAKENPAFYAPNVWPHHIPDFENTFKEMGLLIQSIGRMVAKACDEYVLMNCQGYSPGKIESIVAQSMCCKGRLLHYFPTSIKIEDSNTTNGSEDSGDIDFSDWCGWHNDHCSITGLVPAIYIDRNGDEIPCPDPKAGLYIKSRKGKLLQVKIPTNALAFQIGETAQIHTGGILQATPHAVRGCDPKDETCQGVSRESFAIFMEPEFYGEMQIPMGKSIEDTQKKEWQKNLPPTVKTLRSRWKEGMNFGEFSNATFAVFY